MTHRVAASCTLYRLLPFGSKPFPKQRAGVQNLLINGWWQIQRNRELPGHWDANRYSSSVDKTTKYRAQRTPLNVPPGQDNPAQSVRCVRWF